MAESTGPDQRPTPSGVKVKEIMHAPAGTLAPEVPARDALERLQALRVSTLPVVDAYQSLVGVIRAEALATLGPAELAEPIRSRLSVSSVTATPEMDAGRLAEMMQFKGMDEILVLDARRLVGALTRAEAEAAARGPHRG